MGPDYRFERFEREFVVEDMDFQGSPGPGALFPDFRLPTIGGGEVSNADYVDRRPMLMVFSPFT